MFYSDKKTSSQAAHFVGTDGTEGRRIARRTEPEPEAGEPQVSYEHDFLGIIPGIDGTEQSWTRHFILNCKLT